MAVPLATIIFLLVFDHPALGAHLLLSYSSSLSNLSISRECLVLLLVVVKTNVVIFIFWLAALHEFSLFTHLLRKEQYWTVFLAGASKMTIWPKH
jgi:hypothetical protein